MTDAKLKRAGLEVAAIVCQEEAEHYAYLARANLSMGKTIPATDYQRLSAYYARRSRLILELLS